MENKNSFLTLFLMPVKDFLEDDTISEILINGPKQVNRNESRGWRNEKED